jgi:hypothetical protein
MRPTWTRRETPTRIRHGLDAAALAPGITPTPPAGGPLRLTGRRGGPPVWWRLLCQAFASRRPSCRGVTDPCGYSPAAPTAPPALSGAVELAPMRMSDPVSATCPPWERPTKAASHPKTELAPPQMGGTGPWSHTWQDGALDRVGRRCRRPYRNCGTRSSERLAAPFSCGGRRGRGSGELAGAAGLTERKPAALACW